MTGPNSSLDRITEQSGEDDSTVPAGEDDITSLARVNPNSVPPCEDDIDDQPITESTSETTAEISPDNHSPENSSLQLGEGRTSRGLSPHENTKMADPSKPSVGGLAINRIYYLLTTPGSAAYRAYKRHREGSISLEDLAGEVCSALTGGREQVESYAAPVERLVDELAKDDGVSR